MDRQHPRATIQATLAFPEELFRPVDDPSSLLLAPTLGTACRSGRQESLVKYLCNVIDKSELKFLADIGRDLARVATVLLGKDQLPDPCAVCAEHLCLDAANRQHLPEK